MSDPIQTFLLSDDTLATTLVALLVDRYGADVLDAAPAAICDSLFDDYSVILPALQVEKLQAALTMLTSDIVQRDPAAFAPVARALANVEVDPSSDPPLVEPDLVAWAVCEYSLLTGSRLQPSPELRVYLGKCFTEHGLHSAPEWMQDLVDIEPAAFDTFDSAEIQSEVWTSQQLQLSALEQWTRDRVRLLLEQLGAAPLRNRDAETSKILETRAKRLAS